MISAFHTAGPTVRLQVASNLRVVFEVKNCVRCAVERIPELHIPTERLVAVMLHQSPLTVEESDHLTRCATCKQEMVEAVRKQLGIGKDSRGKL